MLFLFIVAVICKLNSLYLNSFPLLYDPGQCSNINGNVAHHM